MFGEKDECIRFNRKRDVVYEGNDENRRKTERNI